MRMEHEENSRKTHLIKLEKLMLPFIGLSTKNHVFGLLVEKKKKKNTHRNRYEIQNISTHSQYAYGKGKKIFRRKWCSHDG